MRYVTTTTVATLANASMDIVVMVLPVVILTNATKEHTLVTQMLLVLTVKEVLIANATQDTPAMAITVVTMMNVQITMTVTHQPAAPTLMAVTLADVTMDTVEMEPHARTSTNAALKSATRMLNVIIQMVVTLVPAKVDSPATAELNLAVSTLTSV